MDVSSSDDDDDDQEVEMVYELNDDLETSSDAKKTFKGQVSASTSSHNKKKKKKKDKE